MVDPLVKIDFNAALKLFGHGNMVWQESAGRIAQLAKSEGLYSRISQWLEGMPYKHEVAGSSPASATIFL